MRSLGTRRVARAAGAAAIAAFALAGCSAGQVAGTALLKPAVSGLSAQSPDGLLLIRNLQVVYSTPQGYPAGAQAPIELSLFNQSQQPMKVTITSRPPAQATAGVVTAKQIVLGFGAVASAPSANPEPSSSKPAATPSLPADQVSASAAASAPAGAQPTSAGAPASITIPALSSVAYLPGESDPATGLQAVGLSDTLAAGNVLSLVIQADTLTQPIEVLAPVANPMSPVSRAPGIEGENSEE